MQMQQLVRRLGAAGAVDCMKKAKGPVLYPDLYFISATAAEGGAS